MGLINSRQPYNIEFTGTTLEVDLYIYDFGTSTPATPTYSITKTSFETGVSEDLVINISPFINAHYTQGLPTALNIPTFSYLQVDVFVNTVEENHTAFEGFEEWNGGTDGVEFPSNITEDTEGWITANFGSATSIRYYRDNGSYVQYSVPSLTDNYGYTLIKPASFVLGDTKQLLIQTQGAKKYEWRYNVVCTEYTEWELAYINRWGVWDYLTFIGNSEKMIKSESQTYRNFADGERIKFNSNAVNSYKINTGWVKEGFKDIAESLLLSETMYFIRGLETGKCVLKNKSVNIKTKKTEKLINYEFEFEIAGKVLNLV